MSVDSKKEVALPLNQAKLEGIRFHRMGHPGENTLTLSWDDGWRHQVVFERLDAGSVSEALMDLAKTIRAEMSVGKLSG